MKGTFFSADFVRDQNDDLRLIEINTDTGIIESQKSVFDWTEFFNVLKNNDITELVVIYKYSIQNPIIESLQESIEKNAPFITTFTPILTPEDSIFPMTMVDSVGKFILRMAYDETAILDSEYAKGTLNLLKLFVDGGESQSVVNFYHSSRINGNYNTIDVNLSNKTNVPDVIVKSSIEEHKSHNFYKIGRSELQSQDRIDFFLEEIDDYNLVIQQYHYSPIAVDNNDNRISSIRSFQIVYGNDLDLCTVANYEITAVLDLPTEVEFDDTILVNKLSNKHYYEFATNHIKNIRHGFIGDTEILNEQNNSVEIRNTKIGDKFKSYFIEGAPNTDDDSIIRDWLINGNTLPNGSYSTVSSLVDIYSGLTYTNEMTSINFGDNEEIVVGGETRLLIYDEKNDTIKYQRVLDINNGDSILSSNGNLVSINSIQTVIFDEQQYVYALNLEDVDNFILTAQNIHGFSMSSFFTIAHNCFVAGTKIQMEDGTEKSIEDIVVGDNVLSFNEALSKNEIKEVVTCNKNTNKKLVKYHFSNQTSVVATPEHPFYVDGLKLASLEPQSTKQIHSINGDVEEIKVGDLVYVSNGVSKTAIKEIEILDVEDTDTYIFTVKDNHNFYANNVLVHNK